MLTSRIGLIAIAAAALLVAGCEQPSANAEGTAQGASIDGYGNLKFGMSFDEATAIAGNEFFDPTTLRDCLRDRPIRGCLLLSRNDFVPYRTIGGIPYGLKLAFNRFDKLTDIELGFIRRDEDAISSDDCLSIHQRTADWLVKEIGPFDPPALGQGNSAAKTTAGTDYAISSSRKPDWLSANRKQYRDGRQIDLISHFILGSCQISVNWADDLKIERWKLPPDQEAELGGIQRNAVEDSASDE